MVHESPGDRFHQFLHRGTSNATFFDYVHEPGKKAP
jgi:hypothetical protein